MHKEGFGAAAELGNVVLTAQIAVVPVTEILTAKGGRTAEDAIGLAMAAGRNRPGCLLKTGCQLSSPFAVRSSRRAESKLLQAARARTGVNPRGETVLNDTRGIGLSLGHCFPKAHREIAFALRSPRSVAIRNPTSRIRALKHCAN